MGFVSALALLAVIVLIGGTGLKTLPSLLEYTAIKRAINQIATAGIVSPADAQKSFDRYAAIDDITTISGRDLAVTMSSSGAQISFQYEKRIPMVGPVSLLIEFEGRAAGK